MAMNLLSKALLAPLAVAAIITGTIAGASAAQAQTAGSGQLKAAIIFNIIRFVDFAPDGDATLSVCVSRSASAPRELGSLGGQRVGNRTIALRAIDTANPDGCDVVYLGTVAGDVARVRQRGVLVIGEGSAFVGAGGTIGLVQTGSQVRFEVNVRAAREARLEISSKLLRLAARIQQ
jgi:hypothetical protein